MSDVRKQVIQAIRATYGAFTDKACEEIADAILERFDVTPKPVISNYDLGAMMARALAGRPVEGEISTASNGIRMLQALESSGLKIVRVDDEN